ncbi:hypothetical protein BSQ39_02910 [Loigolactobacillus backii]|uniref:HAMP domain-containing sensor histidine kinase n=1 Tax=Loigolactobacillus backii TaxID=375175 RepID=UPI000C1CB054|nr:HAMP domain-containing sensor histidine kinase [Loigolactobacillus backii]PIO82591.1 hypothetical protein BSQ39_02910 [Loigolactobacillus backii]
MKASLYRKSVLVIVIIVASSLFIAFLGANHYYHQRLQPANDNKMTAITKKVGRFYQQLPIKQRQTYLQTIAKSGYQIAVIDRNGKTDFYGRQFRQKNFPGNKRQSIFAGQTYHGIRAFRKGILVTGFFDSDITDTIGVRLNRQQALLLRTDPNVQFGELRVYFTVLSVLAVILALVLLFIALRMLVRPILRLTKATEKIAAGDYQKPEIKVSSRDELGRLIVAFKKMAAALAQVEASRNQFVADVSHDLQSPLTALNGYAKELQQSDLPAATRAEYLQIIQQETERLSSLTKQLLLLASVSQEQVLTQKKSIQVAEQLRQVIQTFLFQLDEKDLLVSTHLVEAIVLGNADLLFQVWQNLLTNAIRYAPVGSTISITQQVKVETLQVEISNQGAQIPPDILAHLFDRFYRADQTRGTTHSGLGLAIAQEIVTVHGGQISVKSTPEVTSFCVSLPLKR